MTYDVIGSRWLTVRDIGDGNLCGYSQSEKYGLLAMGCYLLRVRVHHVNAASLHIEKSRVLIFSRLREVASTVMGKFPNINTTTERLTFDELVVGVGGLVITKERS